MEDVVVVTVPLPAQGHLNQLLHLSRLISGRGVPTVYACSATHNRQARDRLHGVPFGLKNIRFHDLPLPPFTGSPTPSTRDTADLFPTHFQPLFDAALAGWGEPISALLRSLAGNHRRIIVVHDSSLAFVAQLAAAVPNASAYCFHSVSAFASLLFVLEAKTKLQFVGPTPVLPETEKILSGLNLPPLSLDGCMSDGFKDFLIRQAGSKSFSGHLFNTCRPIEGQFVDLLSCESGWDHKNTFAVGPLNPVVVVPSSPRHGCLEWLDRQPPASVIYVSFGSNSSVSEREMAELAEGLERSGQRFVWVVRVPDKADIYDGDNIAPPELPAGFEARVEGRGVVVRGWAPQLEILGHGSTGGFLSHCGWNSCMESMSNGVPVLTWPMHSDQPGNARLVTEVLGVGIAVRDWSKREEGPPTSKVVRDSILKLMVDDEGKGVRERAKVLGESIRRGMSEDGSSGTELDAFIAHITS